MGDYCVYIGFFQFYMWCFLFFKDESVVNQDIYWDGQQCQVYRYLGVIQFIGKLFYGYENSYRYYILVYLDQVRMGEVGYDFILFEVVDYIYFKVDVNSEQ